MDPALIVALLAFVAVGAIGMALNQSPGAERAAKRAKEVAGTAKTSSVRKPKEDDINAKRRAATQENLREMARKQRASSKNLLSVKARLEQAGLTISEQQFWMFSAIAGALIGAAAFFASGMNALWGLGAFFVASFGLPRWLLGMLVGNRQKTFTNQLADAIDIIVRGVKSGLPLNQCLRIIAAESPQPLATEFQMICDGQAMGMPLDANLQRMYDRMPLAEVNFFNIVLVIQQKTGGNLSESLGNLSTVLRSRKLLREKVKALSAEAKASAMIIGALPFIVMALVYVIRPAYMALLFTTPQGNLILLGAALMMGTGIMIMRNMVNFKF
jgi:tight adherence protein B